MRNALIARTLLSAGLIMTLATGCGRGDEGDESAEGSGDLTAQKADVEVLEPEDAAAGDAEGDDASAEGGDAAADEAAAVVESEPAEAGRINFPEGSEGGIVSGELEGGGATDRYVLRALAGQEMSLRLSGVSNGSVSLAVRGAEAQVVASNADAVAAELNRLTVTLPETGDYTITVTAVDGAPRLDYDMEIRVTGEGRITEEGEAEDEADASDEGDDAAQGESARDAEGNMLPIQVLFDAGAEEASFEGSLELGDIVTYVLRATAGQQLRVESESEPAGSVDVMVFDIAGRPMRATRGSAGPAFDLREDGEYSVTASNAITEGSADYSIRFAIAGAAETDGDDGQDGDAATDDSGDVSAGSDTQLFFTTGESSTTVQGSLAAGGQARYRLAAAGGQRLQLNLVADNTDLFQVYVEDEAGNLLASGLEAEGLSVELPDRQDYIVVLIAQPSAPESIYALTVAIE